MKTGESKDEWRKRMFKIKIRITLTLGIEAVPVKLVGRSQHGMVSAEHSRTFHSARYSVVWSLINFQCRTLS